MRLKPIQLALTVLLVLLVVIAIVMLNAGPGKVDICTSIRDKDMRLACTALESENASVCDSVDNVSRNDCLTELALRTRNESVCEKVNQEPPQSRRNLCFLQLAKAANDLSICNRTGGLKAACYVYFAIRNKSSDLCGYAKETDPNSLATIYWPCYAVVDSDPNYCERIEMEDNPYCKVNATECENYVINMRSLCFLTYLEHIPETNASFCLRVVSPLRSVCYDAIANYTQNLSICQSVNDAYHRILCSESILRSPSFCLTSEYPGYCFNLLATLTLNQSLCYSADTVGQCLENVAVSTCNISACQGITEPITRDSCYRGIVKECTNT